MVTTGALVKGSIIVFDGIPIVFLYNPDELPEQTGANYDEVAPLGFSHPVYHYKGGKGRTFSFSISVRNRRRLSLTGTRVPVSVDLYLKALQDLTLPIRKGGKMIAEPPTVMLVLGSFVRKVKILSVETMRKNWNKLLIPTWAQATITCAEVVLVNQNRLNSTLSVGIKL